MGTHPACTHPHTPSHTHLPTHTHTHPITHPHTITSTHHHIHTPSHAHSRTHTHTHTHTHHLLLHLWSTPGHSGVPEENPHNNFLPQDTGRAKCNKQGVRSSWQCIPQRQAV